MHFKINAKDWVSGQQKKTMNYEVTCHNRTTRMVDRKQTCSNDTGEDNTYEDNKSDATLMRRKIVKNRKDRNMQVWQEG